MADILSEVMLPNVNSKTGLSFPPHTGSRDGSEVCSSILLQSIEATGSDWYVCGSCLQERGWTQRRLP